MVHPRLGVPALHRAGRVQLHAQRARLAHQAVGELQRVDADAVRLVHRAGGLVVVAVLLTQLLRCEHARVVAEHFAHHRGLAGQHGHHLGPVRHVQVAAARGVAIDLAGEFGKGLEAGADLGIQLEGHVAPPLRDPL